MTSLTGWCSHGRHDRCSHRPGGPCHGGITLTDGGRYACPCECHGGAVIVGQLELFEVA